MRHYCTILAMLCLAACAPVPPPATPPATALPLFGEGYPSAGDPCRRVGESAETVDFLDDTRDLVGCPAAWEERAAYAERVNAEEVQRRDGWVLYSIPRGI